MNKKFSDLRVGEKFEFINVDQSRIAGAHVKVTRLMYRAATPDGKRRAVGNPGALVRVVA